MSLGDVVVLGRWGPPRSGTARRPDGSGGELEHVGAGMHSRPTQVGRLRPAAEGTDGHQASGE